MATEPEEIILRILSEDASAATREAMSLREYLLAQVHDGLDVTQVKESKNTQDLGATLVLALGAPAAVAVARGVADWLRLRATSAFELEIGGKRIKASGKVAESPQLLADLIEALQSKKGR